MTEISQHAPLELLAPAGSLEAFAVALEEGADAVYVGAPGANARALSRDFSMSEIAWMSSYAHERKKKLYVAMNSLLKESELRPVVEFLSACAEEIHPDALIIQDIGLWFLARTYFPGLPLHASTLLSVHNSTGVRTMESLGIERVVLARELSMPEIRKISNETTAELEVFIHGAMCYSYSGLCLFSSLHGGKSSLRGQCVQPCRRKYTLQSSKGGRGTKGQGKSGYYFSMNDLGALRFLRQLQQTNVVSLKIEGRLRPVEYVRNTVRAYRLCLDNLHTKGKEQEAVEQQARQLLDQAMGRYRCEGYLGKDLHQVIMPQKTGGAGTFLGFCKQTQGKGKDTLLTLVLKQNIQVGDRLRFHDEKQDIRQSFTLKRLWKQNKAVNTAIKGQTVTLQLQDQLTSQRGRPLTGPLFKVDVKGRGKKHSGFTDDIERKLPRINIDPNNIEHVLRSISCNQRMEASKSSARNRSVSTLDWWYRLSSLPPVKQRFPTSVARIILPLNTRNMEQVQQLGKRAIQLYPSLVWALPPIILEKDMSLYSRWLQQLLDFGFFSFQLGMVSQVALFHQIGPRTQPCSLFADYTWNVLNSAALRFGQSMGLKGMIFSIETDRESLQHSLQSYNPDNLQGGEKTCSRLQVGMYAYGYPPLFTARLPVAEDKERQRIRSPKGEQFLVERNRELTQVRSQQPFSLLHAIRDISDDGVDYVLIDLEGTLINKEFHRISRLLKGVDSGQNTMNGNYAAGLL
ncbi:peptidase U32 family protein [Desulfogranum japonicum]|uniref:peptidase U32 family protein n=1 Tax=Desulfogranum japonicum TaxID=231447 RepID=UPI0003FA57AF|nr:peptidase U32 family protein [Desulfogranum japonicum]